MISVMKCRVRGLWLCVVLVLFCGIAAAAADSAESGFVAINSVEADSWVTAGENLAAAGGGITAEASSSQRVRPLVLLTGQRNAEFSIAGLLSRELRREYMASRLSVCIDTGYKRLPLLPVPGKKWLFRCGGSISQPGWADIVIFAGGKEILRRKKVLRIIAEFRVTLTFDDGPGLDKKAAAGSILTSPTVKVLDGLDNFVHGDGCCKRGIKAAFFVLTTPDRFCKIVYPKVDTDKGKAVLREVARRGHVVGVHDGGSYGTQFNSHDKRVRQPPYAVKNLPATSFANALEADLYECVTTIMAVTGQTPQFVRPPLWRYKSSDDPEVEAGVKKAYARYGLKMILTDAKFPDGGYYMISLASVLKYSKFRKNLHRAFLSGEDNLVISMHDSNRYTANVIGRVLEMISEEFARTEFGGETADPGCRLNFADTAAEVRANLAGKRRFAMFPEF